MGAKISIQPPSQEEIPFNVVRTSPNEFGFVNFVEVRCLILILILGPLTLMSQVFIDQSEELGFENFYGECFLAGGVSFTDFDMDGIDDILSATCSGQPVRLYRGTPYGFVLYPVPAMESDTCRSKGVYAVDLDNDGDREIFVSNYDARNRLYWNMGGEYVDVSDEAGISDETSFSFSATFGDYNLDGYLDIYVVNRATVTYPQENILYRNNGDGTFTNVTLNAGVGDVSGAGLAVSFFEYNNDGWPDLYIANDKFTSNVLYVNLGDGTFQNIAPDCGADIAMDGMSVSLADSNGDGYLDIYISNTPSYGNKFLVSNGDLTYTEMSDEMGIASYKFSWGAQFLDFDGDMDEDLFVPTILPIFDNQNELFMRHEGSYIDWSDVVIGDEYTESMGSAKADFDDDGDYDLVVLNSENSGSDLLVNQTNPESYIKFCLEGTVSNFEGVGSWIEVHAGGVIQRRYVTLGSNFAGQDSRYHIFGLGENEQIDLIRITWPSGIVQEIYDQEINVTTCFEEGFATEVSESALRLKISPNPVVSLLNVDRNTGSYSITDLQGQVVVTGSVENGRIDVSQLATGGYLIRIGNQVGRFIKGK